MDPSKDLLAFVSALDNHISDDETNRSKRRKRSKNQALVPDIAAKKQVDISDFAALVEDINPKNQLAPPTSTPLPKTTQTKLERQVALEATVKDVSARWDPFVKKMSQKDSLIFPLNPAKAPRKTAESLMANFVPQNEFERQFVGLIQSASQNNSNLDANSDVKDKMIEFDNFPACDDNNNNASAQSEEAAIKRAKEFYKQQRQNHVSKIKSKTYRKHLAKSRARRSLREKLESGNFGI